MWTVSSGSDVNRPVGRTGRVGRPRFLQDRRDGVKATRPVFTGRGRHDGRGLPGTAKTPFPADILRPRPTFTASADIKHSGVLWE